MGLTTAPTLHRLPDPGVPFVVYAIWLEPAGAENLQKMAISNIPGGPLFEFAVAGHLAKQLAEVYPDELPIVLSLRLAIVDADAGPRGEWTFDYLGQDPTPIFAAERAEMMPSPPTPQTPDELREGEQRMLRESLGIPDADPIPEPAGELPADEQPEAPYRFDPTPHLDLTKAEAAPALPEPAPPGPPPAPGAQTSPVPEIPPINTTRHPGTHAPDAEPFAH
jgi:hypothetical protein